jgi:hypothetical protein
MRLFLTKDVTFISLCVKKKKEIIVFVKKFLNFINKKFRKNEIQLFLIKDGAFII